MTTRYDGRGLAELRPVTIEHGILDSPAGSASIRCGGTWVLCSASIEERTPQWLAGKGRGWVTAEYAMLPAATSGRGRREGWKGKWPKGRTLEIGRLIGRALRGVVRLDRLGERSIVVDCDVIQADGGTRTASVTGGFVALALALGKLHGNGDIKGGVLSDSVCAVSVGILGNGPAKGKVALDMPYEEDARAEVDMNVASTGSGQLIEVQSTAEGSPFSPRLHAEMLELALVGNQSLTADQKRVLEDAGVRLSALIES